MHPVVAHLRAAVFDLDGVLTDTASVHARAWKQLFDEVLRSRARHGHAPQRPFDIVEDYGRFVDGRPRYDGVVAFLASRGITLPCGPCAGADAGGSVEELGDRKDRYFRERLEHDGVEVFPDSIRFIEAARAVGWRTSVASSSRNCRLVLERAGIAGLFETSVDGVVSDQLGLPGKPDPAIFLEAVSRLGVSPQEAMILEDAVAGVEAGRRGRFGVVVGVARREGTDEPLREAGADIVVHDLDELADELRIPR